MRYNMMSYENDIHKLKISLSLFKGGEYNRVK